MTEIKLHLQKHFVTFAITLASTSFTSCPIQLWAQLVQQDINSSKSLHILCVQPTSAREPDNRGAPDDRDGAGTRAGLVLATEKFWLLSNSVLPVR
jgi:hypothetical protein